MSRSRCSLAAVVAIASAVQFAHARPDVAPPSSHPHGLSYSQWEARWWQWAMALPLEGHPFVDSPDFDVREGQTGHVWFLGAPFGGPITRNITIPPGTALFIPTIIAEESSIEGFATEAEQRAAANDLANHARDLFFTVDGDAIPHQERFRFQTQQFGFDAPTPWIFGETGGHGTSVGDGFCFFLEPLSAGHHTIHYGGVLDFGAGGVYTLDMTYNITVRR